MNAGLKSTDRKHNETVEGTGPGEIVNSRVDESR